MPYSWETPVTNRTSTSKYNYTDPNRVDNNSRYLEEYIEANIGYPITLDAYTTQTVNSLPTNALINLLEGNINAIKDAIGFTPTGWQALSEAWAGGQAFLFTDANNLETDLTLLKTMAENIYAAMVYCGTFYCGLTPGDLVTEELL